MGSFVYKFVVENLLGTQKMFDNDILNIFVTGFILFVSFIPAWKSVEWLYNNKLISGKDSGSLIHWIIRLIVGITVFWVIKTILVAILFVKQYWIQVLLMIILSIGIYFGVKQSIKHYKERVQKRKQN
ncbi:hypothetical protein IKO18_05150 [bacterium]|nr:hypothetical protein [bacterium]